MRFVILRFPLSFIVRSSAARVVPSVTRYAACIIGMRWTLIAGVEQP